MPGRQYEARESVLVPGLAILVLTRGAKVVQDQLCYRGKVPNLRPHRHAEHTILTDIAVVPAIRAMYHKARQIHGKEPQRDQSVNRRPTPTPNNGPNQDGRSNQDPRREDVTRRLRNPKEDRRNKYRQ